MRTTTSPQGPFQRVADPQQLKKGLYDPFLTSIADVALGKRRLVPIIEDHQLYNCYKLQKTNNRQAAFSEGGRCSVDRKSTRLNSSHVRISYAVFCLKKKNK